MSIYSLPLAAVLPGPMGQAPPGGVGCLVGQHWHSTGGEAWLEICMGTHGPSQPSLTPVIPFLSPWAASPSCSLE